MPVVCRELDAQALHAYDAVSIKRTPRSQTSLTFTQRPDGGLVMTNGTVHGLIAIAYPGLLSTAVGLPDWAGSERFDVVATGPAGAPKLTLEQQQAMLRAMLADRFKLVVHFEPRDQAVYELSVVPRSSQLKQSDYDCEAAMKPSPSPTMETTQQSTKPLPPSFGKAAPGSVPPCTLRVSTNGVEGETTIAGLAQILRGKVDRPIVDKTGLTGYYKINFQFAEPLGVVGPSLDASLGTRGSVFAQLQDHGLRLERARAALEVLVIDNLERPTPN